MTDPPLFSAPAREHLRFKVRLDLELEIIGSLLQQPELFERIAAELEPEHFTDSCTRYAYEAMLAAHQAGVPPSTPVMVEEAYARPDARLRIGIITALITYHYPEMLEQHAAWLRRLAKAEVAGIERPRHESLTGSLRIPDNG